MTEAHHIYDAVMAESERRWKAEHADDVTVLRPPSSNGHGAPDQADADHQADADRDAETIGAELFTAGPALAQIGRAARARRVSPLAVLGAVLARIAAFTPPDICVPPLVGGHVPLSLYPAVMDDTGGGKSSPMRCAAELIPQVPPGCVGPVGLGTGEGLIELYLGTVDGENDSGDRVRRRAQIRYGALASLDEGRALAEMAARRGSTILSTLCSAWTGGDIGQANADPTRSRLLAAGSYSVGLVSAWQPAKAAALFDDVDGGLPGRMLYLPGHDRGAPDVAPEWPGPLAWQPPASPWVISVMAGHPPGQLIPPRPLDYPGAVRAEVDSARLAKLRGEHTPAMLDSHRNLHRLKLAGVFAQLDQAHAVDVEHWELAGVLLRASDLCRAVVVEHLKLDAIRREDAANARAARREETIATTAERRALVSAARSVGRRAHRDTPDEVIPRRLLSQAIASKHKQLVAVEDVLAAAVAEGWIEPAGEGFTRGRSQPS